MTTTSSFFSLVFTLMISFMVLLGYCSARVYRVGDSEGWTAKEDVNYVWAETDYKEFHMRDSLIFKYDPGLNNVYEISGDLEFMTCDPTSHVAVHKTGHDLVRLTKPRIHYFISSRSCYCEAGLKLRVMVGSVPKTVTYPNFSNKVDISAMERLNNW